MTIPTSWDGRISLPAIAAPMFLASNANLTVECCRAGVIGTAPALNQRDNANYESYLLQVEDRLTRIEGETGIRPAPHGVNLSLRRGNPRLEQDLLTTIKHKVPLVITSLGISREIVERIHGYGGLVFHDVINLRFAEKAATAGVDGIIAVAAGAGGHGGAISPFAFLAELQSWYRGCIILAGCITNGRQIAAARLLGADLVSIGTRFLATQESGVTDDYKTMVLNAHAADIAYTHHMTGVSANFLIPSLAAWALDPNDLGSAAIDPATRTVRHGAREGKVWRDIWSAGQGVGTIEDVPTVAALCQRLSAEYTMSSHPLTPAGKGGMPNRSAGAAA